MPFPDEDDADRIEVMIEDPRWDALDLPALAATALEAVLADQALLVDAFGISVLACDDARIAELNGEFRDKPRPTNVLSWPFADRSPDAPGERPLPPEPGAEAELGDIALAFDTCAAEAAAAHKPLADHVLHLLVHSVLHLLGYDHETDPDAALMEGTESRILAGLGQPDPYRTNADHA